MHHFVCTHNTHTSYVTPEREIHIKNIYFMSVIWGYHKHVFLSEDFFLFFFPTYYFANSIKNLMNTYRLLALQAFFQHNGAFFCLNLPKTRFISKETYYPLLMVSIRDDSWWA